MKQPNTRLRARRIEMVDAIRGVAVMAMVCYHLGFDLNYLKWIHFDIIHDWRWLLARGMILASFLLTVGASYALAEYRKIPLNHKLERIAKIGAAALLVTAASWLMFPESVIYFGTLHAIAVMSLLLLWLPRQAGLSFVAGLAVIGAGYAYSNPIFNSPALAWLGLMTYKPLTEDYVPLLPWFGFCLSGYAMTKLALLQDGFQKFAHKPMPRWVTWLGRHSLAIYLLHQPLLLGVLVPATRLLNP